MIDNLMAHFKPLRDRIDALSLRERGMIFGAVVIVLYMIAANLVFAPFQKDQTHVEKELAAKQKQIRALNLQIDAVLGQKDVDPDKENQAKLIELKKQLLNLDANLGEMTKGFVPPQEMAKMVEQILKKNRRLEVLRVENMPSMPIGDDGQEAEVAEAPSDPVARQGLVYKHGLRIELRGRYFDIISYLRELEGLEWKVFWGQVNLASEDYPMSKLTLVIYTLSSQPGWIGV